MTLMIVSVNETLKIFLTCFPTGIASPVVGSFTLT